MNHPKVSIVIPVYNVEIYITDCLQSVMNQTYQGPMECIVVDDCGTDKSMDIAESLIAEYNGPIEFRVLHHEKNLGLSCARNTGIDAALGDYVFFLDSDDIITDDCVDVLTSQLKKGDFDVVVGNNDCFGKITKLGMLIPEEGLKVSGEQFVMRYLDGRQVVGAAWNKLYSLDYLKKNNMLFEPGLALEDHVYNFRLSCYPTKMYVINRITYHYRFRREGSIDCELVGNPEVQKGWLVQVWKYIRSYCEADKYNEIHEMALHCYGKIIVTYCQGNHLEYKDIFCNLNRNYPYHPVLIWLSGKRSFRWLISRLIWVFPPLIAFYYYVTMCMAFTRLRRIKSNLSNASKQQ